MTSRTWALVLLVLLPHAAGAVALPETTGGWQLSHVHLDAAPATFEVVADARGATVLGILLYGPVDVSAIYVSAGRGTGAGSHVIAESVGGMNTVFVATGPHRIHLHTEAMPPGEYAVVQWAVGYLTSWAPILDLPSGTSPSKTLHGADAYFWDGSRPTSGSHFHATLEGHGAGAWDATYELDVKDNYVGLAGWSMDDIRVPLRPPIQTAYLPAHATHPDGTTSECPCTSPSPVGRDLMPWGPGTHQISMQGVHAHANGQQPFVLAGVDVPLP